MRYILIIISVIGLFYGCDNRKDPYFDLDDIPILTVQKLTDSVGRTSLADSMKLGNPYTFKYKVVSFEDLNINIEKGRNLDNIEVDNGLINVNTDLGGISSLKLVVKDAFGKTSSANVQVTFFKNLAPVCKLTVTQIAQLSPYEIDINASASFDQDAKWGGSVVKWEYQVQANYDKQTDLNDIHYICDSPGQKKITVRCQDNDGTWSAPQTIYFMVN
jgi:hypothetical protein